MTDETKAFEQIALIFHPEGKLLRTWRLEGGISATMTVLEIKRLNGQTQKLIVRQPRAETLERNPRAAAEQFKLLKIVRGLGIAAQKPYLLDESGTIFDSPYLVVEYIEGATDYSPVDLRAFAVQAATQLVKIHGIDGRQVDLSFLPKQVMTLTQPSEEMSADENRIRAALESVGELETQNKPLLLHGDFWAGNWLWRNGQLAAVIDWEDAHIGDPLADFAISRLDMLLIFGKDAMEAFTRRYYSISELDFRHLPYWDLRAALRAVPNLGEWSAFYPSVGRTDITEGTMRAAHQQFTAQALAHLRK